MYRAIIVDDEPAARRMIRHLCNEHVELAVIEEAPNGTAAVELVNSLKPDVVFLDIQMPDITGLEVLGRLTYTPNIIFTTAHEEFALKAFETFTVDYLLKPIKEERFKSAIQKLKSFGRKDSAIDFSKLQRFLEEVKPKIQPKAFPVKIGDRIIFIEFGHIAYFEANDKYVNLFSIDGNKHLVDLTLSMLEEKLPPDFIRVQKSYIINRALVKEVHKHFNSRFVLVLNDKSLTHITTGLTYFDVLKKHLSL